MSYKIGLNIGMTSTGWAVIGHEGKNNPEIIKTGVRVFDAAEKGDTSVNARHKLRIYRRKIRRKKFRLKRVRELLLMFNVVTRQELKTLFENQGRDIYEIRYAALNRFLYRDEWARLLIHLMQRRGYVESERKKNLPSFSDANQNVQSDGDAESPCADGTGTADDFFSDNFLFFEGKEIPYADYRTIGEMLYLNGHFRQADGDRLIIKTRNSSNDYRFIAPRRLLVAEIREVFKSQREKGNLCADDRLEKKYIEIFTAQRDFEDGPGAGSPYKGISRGFCPAYKTEQRAAKASYLNELVRLATSLNYIIIRENCSERTLTAPERAQLMRLAHTYNTIKYSDVEKIVQPGHDGSIFFKNERFERIKVLTSYHRLKKAFGFDCLYNRKRQQIYETVAEILTSFKNDSRRIYELRRAGVKEELIPSLCKITFYGSAFLSLRALKEILPYLNDGNKFADAYGLAFKTGSLKKKKKKKLSVSDCNEPLSPGVKRALSQSFKVLNAIVRTYGNPKQVFINLDSDIKYSHSERKQNEELKKQYAEQNRAAADYLMKTYKFRPAPSDLLKFRLWREQKGICFYSGSRIPVEDIFKPNACEVDHIIPYSKSYDDSYSNKLLVKKAENSNKKNRTAYEFVSGDTERLNRYSHLVNAIITDKKKRKNLFRAKYCRNEKSVNNDSRNVMRVIRTLVKDNLRFERGGGTQQHVVEVNGMLTAYLTEAFFGNRDACISRAAAAVAAAVCDNGYSKKALSYIDKNYDGSEPRTTQTADLPEPWCGFRAELNNAVCGIFVSRMPKRKATGRAHKETVRSSRVSGTVIKMELNRLRLNEKTGEIENYYKPETDMLLYNALKERLKSFGNNAEDAFREPFYKPKADGAKGPPVKKVKLTEKTTLGVSVRGGNGIAANGNMIRIDVFRRADKYFFVPVYVSDTVREELPYRAVVAHKPYAEWEIMDGKEFLFSLYQNELIRITHKRELKLKGKNGNDLIVEKNTPLLLYFLGANISAGTISTVTHDGAYYINGLGIKTLISLEKLSVDPLGNYFEEKVPQERQQFRKTASVKEETAERKAL